MILDSLAPGYCIPIRIGDGPSLSGPRIGGSGPIGVSPERLAEADYLLTLMLDDDHATEVSLFLNHDWWDFSDYYRCVLGEDEPWIEFVVHGSSERGLNNSRRSLLTPFPLIYGPAILDQQGYFAEDGEAIPNSDHKIGGRPFIIKSETAFVNAIQKIEQNGFHQLFQLAFPGSRDANIAGDWPFGDGIFNLFFKREAGTYHWYYFWQF